MIVKNLSCTVSSDFLKYKTFYFGIFVYLYSFPVLNNLFLFIFEI